MAKGFADDVCSDMGFSLPADPEYYPDKTARYVCSACWWGVDSINGKCRKCGSYGFLDLGIEFERRIPKCLV